jgi:PIN domain nuclease of toxin-antitoxin system
VGNCDQGQYWQTDFAPVIRFLIPQQMTINGIKLLDITVSYTSLVSKLQYHHGDPFDRTLIAQAIVENLAIISADSAFDAYGVQRLW